MNFLRGNKKGGYGIIEVLIGAAVVSISFFSISAVFQRSLQINRENTRALQAAFLLEEGIEAMRTIRDRGWTANIASIPVGATRFFYFDGDSWEVVTSTTVVDGITRSFSVANVYRDGTNDISETGTLDPDTRKIIERVLWERNGSTTSRSLTSLITNINND